MTRNLQYLKELLESLQSVVKPVDETDESIPGSWDEVFATIKELQQDKTDELIATGPVEEVVGKFREVMQKNYPDGKLAIDALVGDAAIMFNTGKDQELKCVVIY